MREVFWQKGYAATSLDDLTAITGMNRPSLYNAFGEKAQVFKAVLDEYVDETRPRYERAFTTPGLRAALTAVYETAFDIYKELDPKGLGCFMIGAALTDSVRDPEVADMILTRLHEMDRGFGWLLKRAEADGELRQGVDRRALTMLASSTHSTLSVRMRAGEPHDQLRKFVGQMIDIICA
jgi:AcrR family transcriptional regulator